MRGRKISGELVAVIGTTVMRTLEWGCHIEEVAKSGWAYLSPALGKRMAQTSRWEGIGRQIGGSLRMHVSGEQG